MPEFRLYNSLTRSVEPFVPADGETVRLYACGPTVYNPAHLGNFRTFLFEDLMRRVLRLRGWKVVQVMNLTDVDDKIIKRASEQGKTIQQVTDPIVTIFHEDRKYLRIEDAELNLLILEPIVAVNLPGRSYLAIDTRLGWSFVSGTFIPLMKFAAGIFTDRERTVSISAWYQPTLSQPAADEVFKYSVGAGIAYFFDL